MGILDFLFGKRPNIFDKDGTVRHQLSKEKWAAWNNRYQQNKEYNWRNHTGMRTPQDPSRPKTQA